MKRHHKPSDSRKAKMDALIQELEAEKDQIPKKTRRFVPDKKGSFVDPGEEHLTTNIFVGNLAPSIAEEVKKRKKLASRVIASDACRVAKDKAFIALLCHVNTH